MSKNLLLILFLVSLGEFLIGAQLGVDNYVNNLKWAENNNHLLFLPFLYDCIYYGSAILAIIFAIIFGNKYSRKRLITVLIYVMLFGTAVEFAVDLFSNNVYLYSAINFIVNFTTVFIDILIPVYIAEISQVKNRGAFLCFYSLMFALGNSFSSYFAGKLLNYCYILSIIPGIIIAIVMHYIPDTPRWLCLKDKENEATKVLSKLNNASDFDDHIRNEIRSIQRDVSSKHSLGLRRIISVYFMSLFQEFIGYQFLTMLIYHHSIEYFDTPEIENTSENNQVSNKVLMVVPIIKYLSLFLVIFVVDRVGRKRLLSYGSLLLMILYITYSVINISTNYESPKYAIFILLYFSLFVYHSTWGIIPYVYGVEIFPIHCRVKGYAIYSLFIRINSIISSYLYPFVLSYFGDSGLFLYSAICLIAFIFTKLSVIETKGVALEEMEEKFYNKKDSNKIENQV